MRTPKIGTARWGYVGAATLVAGILALVVGTQSSSSQVVPHWETGLVTVLKAATTNATIADGSTVAAGTSVYDTAVLSYNEPQLPTGTVTYSFFDNLTCSGDASSKQQVAVTAYGTVLNSDASGPLGSGDYAFMASYSGDFEYPGSTSSCEPFTEGSGTTTTTTSPGSTTTTSSPTGNTSTTTTSSPTTTSTSSPATTTTTSAPTTTTSSSTTTTSSPTTTTTSPAATTSTTAPSSPTTTTSSPSSTTSTTAPSSTTTSSPGDTTTSTTSTTTPATRGSSSTSTTLASGTQGGSPSGTVTAPASALAFTGPGPGIRLLAGLGGALVLAGASLFGLPGAWRRRVRRP